MNQSNLVLLEGARTAMAEFGGPFARVSALKLGAHAAKEAISRSGLEPADIDSTFVGNALQTSPDAIYGARHVALNAGVPIDRPALTVNRLCGSGLQSIVSAAQSIQTGESGTCLVGGMENMTQAPHCIWGAREGFRLGQGKLEDLLMVALYDPYCGCFMAQTSNNLARDYDISRADQDEFALLSQQRAAIAAEAGVFAEEIVPVEIGKGRRKRVIERDEHIRPETTLEGLGALPTVFGDESFVTAGNASGIVDGAAMLVLTTGEVAESRGVTPLGRIRSWAVVGVEPSRMGIGPAPAIAKALDSAGLTLDDLDLIEVNEAFAGQILAVVREMNLDIDRLNVNGGAIALGHPLGATGSRLVLTLLKELGRRGGGLGVASACIGGGQGIAMVVEVGE